jgi:hypothetical protein
MTALTHSFLTILTHSFMTTHNHSLTHALTHSFLHTFTDSCTHSLIHAHSLTHSFSSLQLDSLNMEKNKLHREKVDLENQLEAEQEYIMNKLQKQVKHLAAVSQ